MRVRGVVALVAMGALAAACSSEPEATTVEDKRVPTVSQAASEPPKAEGPDPGDYMEAVNAEDPEIMRDTAAELPKGSPAAVYLIHQANMGEAMLDGGIVDESVATVQRSGNAYKLCYQSPAQCLTYDNFETNSNGVLVGFSIDGTPVEDTLVQGDGEPVSAGGGQFTFLTAYNSPASNTLFVTMKVESGSEPLGLNLYTATYRSPSGKQRGAADGGGPTDLGARSNALAYTAFSAVDPGGRVTLDGCVADCEQTYKVSFRLS